MKDSVLASAVIKSVLDRREEFGNIYETEPEGTRTMWYISGTLQKLTNDELFALYTEFEAPSVSHELMEEWDFSEYDNPISLMRFTIGLQILEIIRTYFPDNPETSLAYDEVVSYIKQTVSDLSTHIQRQIETAIAPEREQESLLDFINEALTAVDNLEERLA
jgi:hypothetical protein